jgi:polyribonucleotide nucleotidyltransferase
VTTSDSSSPAPKVGDRFHGTVSKTAVFGAFVTLTPGVVGLLHVTQVRQLAGGRKINSVDEVLHVGDTIEVVIQEIDDRGKLSLIPAAVFGP